MFRFLFIVVYSFKPHIEAYWFICHVFFLLYIVYSNKSMANFMHTFIGIFKTGKTDGLITFDWLLVIVDTLLVFCITSLNPYLTDTVIKEP